jgi:uncharacterized membrane protein YphA (DoxX/SURF4 family)
MKLVKEISRFLVGGIFIFSGLIKINDPIGTAIKLEEYFEVFAYDFAPFFEWFIPLATFLSIFLNVLEIALGVALIIGYQVRWTSWILLILIVFFSFLTFYSAYFNKVTDCGCFGDAIKLSPWQSFTKDIVLLAFILIIFLYKDSFKPLLRNLTGHVVMAVTVLLFIWVGLFAIWHLPYIDFRAYAVGNHLPTLMQPSGELKYEYIMEKDGKEYRFEQYPTDESYSFVTMKVLNPEVQPVITDFSVWNNEGEFTQDFMEGKRLIVAIQSVDKTSTQNMEQIRALLDQSRNMEIWALTSSSPNDFESFAEREGLDIPYYFVDATVLKAMIRSSPGILAVQDGTVLGKWHHNDTPSASEVGSLLN